MQFVRQYTLDLGNTPIGRFKCLFLLTKFER